MCMYLSKQIIFTMNLFNTFYIYSLKIPATNNFIVSKDNSVSGLSNLMMCCLIKKLILSIFCFIYYLVSQVMQFTGCFWGRICVIVITY